MKRIHTCNLSTAKRQTESTIEKHFNPGRKPGTGWCKFANEQTEPFRPAALCSILNSLRKKTWLKSLSAIQLLKVGRRIHIQKQRLFGGRERIAAHPALLRKHGEQWL